MKTPTSKKSSKSSAKKRSKKNLRKNGFSFFGKKKDVKSFYEKDDAGYIGVGDGTIVLSSEKQANFFEVSKALADILTFPTDQVKIEFVPKADPKKRFLLNRKPPPPKTREEMEREQMEELMGGRGRGRYR